MPILDALDATRICGRSSAALADPQAWARTSTVLARRSSPEPQHNYSWWSLVTNPQALLLTGMIGTTLAKTLVAQLVSGAGTHA